jgi:uncharacterized YokU family protein
MTISKIYNDHEKYKSNVGKAAVMNDSKFNLIPEDLNRLNRRQKYLEDQSHSSLKPDGSRAIRITALLICKACDMLYQTDEVTKVIEDQLFLVDTKVIGHTISYKELMELPRLLKRNYFDFSSEYVFSGH